MRLSGREGPSAPGRYSNLQLRVMSAVVLAVVVLAVTWLGGLPFRLLAVLIAAAVLYEWLAMTASLSSRYHNVLLAGLLALFAIPMLLPAAAAKLFLLLAVSFALGCAHALICRLSRWPALGIAYAGCGALSLALLRGADTAGLVAILFLFAVVWATDIAAYFVGRRVGGPKLAPRISPGKTWSGAIGGTIVGVVAGVALAAAAGLAGLWLHAALALLVSVVSQAGDLFESAVKRRFGAKDSSNLIPGHGGVMDRVDGLVAGAFALYVIGAIISGPAGSATALFSP